MRLSRRLAAVAPALWRLLPLALLPLAAGCTTLTAGVDVGGVAERSGELDAYVSSYNAANAATLARDLGSLSTRAGTHAALSFGGEGTRFGTSLRLGVDQGKRRASSRFDDGSERRMRLRFSSFFGEVDAGLARGPRAVLGLDVRNTYLQAIIADVNENISDAPRACAQTNAGGTTCTTGRFSTLTTALYAGATVVVPVRGRSGVRLTLTRPVSELSNTTDGRLRAFPSNGQIGLADYGFPRSIDDASPDRRRAVPALLRPFTLRAAISLNGRAD